MFVSIRALSAIVLAACLLGRPAVGRSAIRRQETVALRAAVEDLVDAGLSFRGLLWLDCVVVPLALIASGDVNPDLVPLGQPLQLPFQFLRNHLLPRVWCGTVS